MASFMFNGRRLDLDQLAGQARALWQAQTGLMADSRAAYLLSRATLLSLFAAVVCTRSELAQFDVHTLPALLFPFLIVVVALAWLRRINVQINFPALARVQLPFHTRAAPLMQRLSLHVTTLVERSRSLALNVPLPLLPLPVVQLKDNAAVQSIMLFAQRMSRNWLELSAMLAALLAIVDRSSRMCAGDETRARLSSNCPARTLLRTPQVTVLRC
jgi:hypothetical protein